MGPLMRRSACAAAAILAVVLVLSWSALRIHFTNNGNWTALFCVGDRVPLPPDLDAVTYRIPHGGYDGQFYRLLAHDPSLARHYARYVDAPQYRFRRCLIPMAAWLLALGRQSWIDAAYIAIEMIFVGLGVYWCARLFVRRARSPVWGLLFGVLPATLASFDRMLTDGPLTALFAGFLLYCEEERWTRVWLLATMAALARETGLLLVAALVADRLLRRNWRGAVIFAGCALPALGWYLLLRAHLPTKASLPEIGWPLWNLFGRLLIFRDYFTAGGQLVLRATDFLAVAGLIATIAIAAVWLRRTGFGPQTICVALYSCLALVLGPPVMIDPFAFGRVISPLLLWILLEAVARRKWAVLGPPLAISIAAGLVFVRPAITIAETLFRR